MANKSDLHISEHDNYVFTIRQITCIKTDVLTKIKTMRIHYNNSTYKDIKNNSIEYKNIYDSINNYYNLYKSFEHEIYNMSVYHDVKHFSGCNKLIDEFENRKELLYYLKCNIKGSE